MAAADFSHSGVRTVKDQSYIDTMSNENCAKAVAVGLVVFAGNVHETIRRRSSAELLSANVTVRAVD